MARQMIKTTIETIETTNPFIFSMVVQQASPLNKHRVTKVVSIVSIVV